MSSESFEKLAVGHEFPPASYQLTEPIVSKYVEAVGEHKDFLTSGIVPSLGVAAYTINALAESFGIPPGAIHASQEFEFLKIVPIGTTISCGGKIVQRVERGRLLLVVFEVNAMNQDKEKVLTGKATVAIPRM